MREMLVKPELTENDLLRGNVQTFAERAVDLKKAELLSEKNRKSAYSNFLQLNRDNINHMISACKSNQNALQILLFLLEKMDRMNALVCSYKVIQEQLGISRSTASRAIQYLRDKGFIYVYKSGTSNVYVVNDDLAWTTYGDKQRFCQFPANIVLSASEQEELANDKKASFSRLTVMNEKKEGQKHD